MQIAIDGPIAAGKSTVAQAVAQKLGIVYLNSGFLYRYAAQTLQDMHIDIANERRVCDAIDSWLPAVEQRAHELVAGSSSFDQSILANSQIADAASQIGTYRCVRHAMVALQQRIADGRDIIIEGRDAALRVLPDAAVKIYLTAALPARIKRKQRHLASLGIPVDEGEIVQELVRRDQRDNQRAVDPLHKTADTHLVDTTHMRVPDVVEHIVAYVQEQYGKK